MTINCCVVSSKEAFGKSPAGRICGLPNRHLGRCHECHSVQSCDFPEAAHGRYILAKRKETKILEQATEARKQTKRAEKDLMAVGG